MSFKSRSLQFLFEFSPRKTIRCATHMHALETIYEYIFEPEERYCERCIYFSSFCFGTSFYFTHLHLLYFSACL